jgi:hypothetical protein
MPQNPAICIYTQHWPGAYQTCLTRVAPDLEPELEIYIGGSVPVLLDWRPVQPITGADGQFYSS